MLHIQAPTIAKKIYSGHTKFKVLILMDIFVLGFLLLKNVILLNVSPYDVCVSVWSAG